MKKYIVTCTMIHNATIEVEANDKEQAFELAQNKLDSDEVNWIFGEKTIDYVEREYQSTEVTKKYIDYKQFEKIIENLKFNEEIKIFVKDCEAEEDEEGEPIKFKRMVLFNDEGVFYESPLHCHTCMIQDDFAGSEELKSLWEDLTDYGENKIYIEE